MEWILNRDEYTEGIDSITKERWKLEAKNISVPIYSWCKKPDKGTIEQLINLAKLPFLFHHIGIMADGHPGYGMPIGGVAATHGVLMPYCVGNDIGCGMIAVCLDYRWENLTPELIDRIMKETVRVIPHGKGISHRQPQPWDKFDDAPEFPLYIKSVLDESRYQLGTLGSGNHFIEMLKGDDSNVWLMIHSGSRNLGYQICNEFYQQSKRLNEMWKIKLPDPRLSYLPIETKEGKHYFEMMNFALDYAKENRSRMMTTFMSIACGMLKSSPIVQYVHNDIVFHKIDIHHNYAKFEGHLGKNVIVHRKGATPAFKDMLGIIPGSMSTPSYIVKGKGCRDSFCTVSHGAGRKYSRKYANGKFKQQENKNLDGIWMNKYSPEEDQRCYKDIEEVMSSQSDLVDPVVKMEPLAVIIGTDRREFGKKKKK